MKIIYKDKNAYTIYFHSDSILNTEKRMEDVNTYMASLPGVTSIEVERYAMMVNVALLFDPKEIKKDLVGLMIELWQPDMIEELTHDNIARHIPFYKNAQIQKDTLEAMLALFNEMDSPEA